MCHSFPIKGTTLGEIGKLSVLSFTGLVHLFYTILTFSLLLLCLCCYIQQVNAAIKLYNELYFVTFIYIYTNVIE